MRRTANPSLKDTVFQSHAATGEDVMTIQGTVMKTGILVGIATLSASYVWHSYFAGSTATGAMILFGLGVGLLMALVTIFKPSFAPITAPLYAALEGLALGGISAMYQEAYMGLPMMAVSLTLATLAGLLIAYKSGIIKATENFRLGIFAATAGIALFYLVAIVFSFFGVQVPLIHDTGWMGIGFSLFVVGIAALNLVLDFDFIERGAEEGAAKYMEWYGAFGLLVTLVWLYLEMLRLLAKLQSRD